MRGMVQTAEDRMLYLQRIVGNQVVATVLQGDDLTPRAASSFCARQ
jgi:hypothetical protein